MAALAVIVGHSFTLTGVAPAPRVVGIPIHSLGLYTFFAISGYLIAKSWNRNPNVATYLANRSLRIFPALVVVVLATVIFIGPAVSVLDARQYFQGADVYEYLQNVLLLAQYDLPGVFETGHRSSAVNGVLWTLGLEFVCYLVVAVVGIMLGPRKIWGYFAFGLIAVGFALVPGDEPWTAWMGPAGTTWVFFAAGALLSGYGSRRRVTLKSLALVIPTWVGVVAVVPDSALFVAWLALPYTVLTLGLASTPGIRSAARFGDLSYGTYLWGFLVQQLVIEWFDPIPWLLNTSIVVIATAAIAFASWHVVEKRALALKIELPAAAVQERSGERASAGA